MSKFQFKTTHSDEFRYARALCAFGMLLACFLGMLELGSPASSERRRLGSKDTWNAAVDSNGLPKSIGDENGYTFLSKKDRKNTLNALFAPMLHVGAILRGLCTLIPEKNGTTNLTYKFRLGNGRVLVALTQPKLNGVDTQYAYLKRIKICRVPVPLKRTDELTDPNELFRYSVSFVMNGLGWSKISNRIIFYLSEKELKVLQTNEPLSEPHSFAELLRAMMNHEDLGLTISTAQSTKFCLTLSNPQQTQNDKFLQIKFFGNEEEQVRALKIAACIDPSKNDFQNRDLFRDLQTRVAMYNVKLSLKGNKATSGSKLFLIGEFSRTLSKRNVMKSIIINALDNGMSTHAMKSLFEEMLSPYKNNL